LVTAKTAMPFIRRTTSSWNLKSPTYSISGSNVKAKMTD